MSRQVRCNRCQAETTARWVHIQTQERWDGHTSQPGNPGAREQWHAPYQEGVQRRDLCPSCASAFEQFMQGEGTSNAH
jgi:hypothetical protein